MSLTMEQMRADDRRFGNSAPARSLQQRMDALAKGNEHRTHRKNLKLEIAAGRTSLADALLEPIPDWLQTMKVIDLVLAVPKVGRVKANTAFSKAGLSHSKTVGGMTDRQRAEMVARFGR